jgi:monoamine oxidase
LAQAGVDVSVHEANNRVGGRMYSTPKGDFAGGQVAELGGELIDTDDVVMQRLAAEFDVQLDYLPRTLPPSIRFGYGYYLEGRWIQDAEGIAAFKPVAEHIHKLNRELAQTGLAHGADAVGQQRIALDRKYANLETFLDEVGASSLAKGICRYAYVGEFGRELDELSAINILDEFACDSDDGCAPYEVDQHVDLFAGSNEVMRIHDGNETLPRAIAAAIADRITLGSRLVKVARSATGYAVSFADASGATKTVQAPYLVLALPFTLLREVELDDTVIAPDNAKIIREIGYGTNAKLMGQFTTRDPWRNVRSDGTLVTDLSSTMGRHLHNVWDTSRGQDGPHGLLTNFVGGKAGLSIAEGTPEEQLKSNLPALMQPYPGIEQAYMNGSAKRMVWATMPFAKGSYRCTLAGQIGLADNVPTHEEGGRLQYCGEHIAVDQQGFMEGAALTGANAAAAILANMAKIVPPPLASIRRVRALASAQRARL